MPSLAHPLSAPAQPTLRSIGAVAAIAQTSPAVLRIWEQRYGWPRPERRAEGTRGYTPEQVADLVRLVRLVRRGHRIGDLLADGRPRWPGVLAPKPTRTAWTFEHIPQPTTPAGRTLRRQAEAALQQHDAGAMAGAIAAAVRLHPAEREHAVYALLAAAGRPVSPQVPATDASHPRQPSPAACSPGDPAMSTTPTPPADPAQPPPVTGEAPPADPAAPTPAAPAAGGAFDLIGALRAKMAAERLSIRVAARAIGIPHPLLWQVLSRRALPSAAKAPRFAAWLGVDVALLPRTPPRGPPARSMSPTPSPTATPPERTRRTRPAAAEHPSRATPTMVNRPLDEVLAAVRAALLPPVPSAPTPVHPIVRDQLAMAVHAAPTAMRKVIASILTVSGRGARWRSAGRSRRR